MREAVFCACVAGLGFGLPDPKRKASYLAAHDRVWSIL